jgi:hypothetical protein
MAPNRHLTLCSTIFALISRVVHTSSLSLVMSSLADVQVLQQKYLHLFLNYASILALSFVENILHNTLPVFMLDITDCRDRLVLNLRYIPILKGVNFRVC